MRPRLFDAVAAPAGADAGPSWWIDWDDVRCVRDCVGPSPCSNEVMYGWYDAFDTVRECCDYLYGSLEVTRVGSCAGTEGGDTDAPSRQPTSAPSQSPTTSPTHQPTATPSSSPLVLQTPSPTASPTSSDAPTSSAPPSESPRLRYVGDNGSPDGAFPLSNCEGDCDADVDCKGDLVCFERDGDEPVPGCQGNDSSRTDYCCEFVEGYLFYVGDDGEPEDRFPLGPCLGDCDDDDECEEGLICQKRGRFEPVLGCEGLGIRGKDYCRYNTILGECEAGCNTDDECEGSLQCFGRFNNETVPGCSEWDYDSNYCIDRPDNLLFIAGNNGDPRNAFPLGFCEGDCDGDSECEGELLCQHRDEFEEVLGCQGIGKEANDYCRYRRPDDGNYTVIGLCENGEDNWQGPEPSLGELALSFFVLGDTPYDDSCDVCNTCIGNDGIHQENCEQYDCILDLITMPELDPDNTCTYSGPEYECLQDGIIPYVNSKINSGEAAFVAHVGDILKGADFGTSRRCTDASFTSRKVLFANATNFLLVPGDNDWNDCYGYDLNSNTDQVRELWRGHFAGDTSPFHQFSRDFPMVVGGGRPTIDRKVNNTEMYYFMYNSVAIFGLNYVQGKSYVKDNDLNAEWVEQKLNLDANCTIKSIILISHTDQTSDVDEKLNSYFDVCGRTLPTLLVHGNDHPDNYCLQKNGKRLTLTVEPHESGPLKVSVVRDGSDDFFHVNETDQSDSDNSCSLKPTPAPTTPSPTGPPVPQPTYSPNNYGAHYVPGDLSVRCDNGMLTLSKGMACKMIAMADQPIVFKNDNLSEENMHKKADGAGVIPHPSDGGWYYVSNSEVGSGRGGVGAIRFDADGGVVGYEQILKETSRNCGGGLTYWGTWVSCEENKNSGYCYEVDPYTGHASLTKVVDRPGNYESFAYDNEDPDVAARFFTTEDDRYGALVRYTPHPSAFATNNSYDILTTNNGTYDFLVLHTNNATFTWSPNRAEGEASAFALFPNSEGIDQRNRVINFTSKKKRQLFTLDLAKKTWFRTSTESGAFDEQPDQLARISGDDGDGVLYFCEDGGPGKSDIHGRDTTTGEYYTIVTGEGYDAETTGLAFSPDSKFMYVSFQDDSNIYSFWREDGLPFHGAVADIKYHASSS